MAIPHPSLQTYLTGLGTATLLASTANASIVLLDVSSISDPNAGLSLGASKTVDLSTLSDGALTGTLNLYNGAHPTVYTTVFGLGGTDFLFALTPGDYPPLTTTLSQFSAGYSIASGDMQFGNETSSTAFYFDFEQYPSPSIQPAWGSGSYLGFNALRAGDFVPLNGWMEVLWDPSTKTFQILAAAYEETPGEAILTGAIPEPSSLALLVAGASGVAYLRRRTNAA